MERWKCRSWNAIARNVGRLFFPLRETLGLDARELTPGLASKVVITAAETRSFVRAAIVMDDVAGMLVSPNTIQRVVGDVGRELAERRDADPRTDETLAQRPEAAPDLAVVECDGGRLRTRDPDGGPGVHFTGDGWREDKNACLIRAQRTVFAEDPQPEPPACFCDPKHVAKIAETETLSIAAPLPGNPAEDKDAPDIAPCADEDWRPKRLVRTVLSSMACSDDFGQQMAREAKRRRFFESPAKVFLGDGLQWNWSIWKKEFRDFTPILDFIHPLSYLFVAAKAIHASAEDAWSQYIVWMRGCWQGEVSQVLEELRCWQEKLGPPPSDVPENDPRRIVAKAITYFEHNTQRMHYPEYRQQGFPITTAWMESLVKEINYRVKGTEMFWNDPEGAEAILQVRAAALCDDDRLKKHLRTRPGHPFTRRSSLPRSPARKYKS